MQFNTPLRYPGGKGRLSQFIADAVYENNIAGGSYCEPYAGGAGIAVTLLLLEYVSKIYINDINRSVFAFWHSVLNEPDALCSLISSKRISMTEWHRQRAVQYATDVGMLELGFSTFYLNRTNRSGIILGGVIGGKDQSGDWKLDARYNKADLIRRIEKIASMNNRIKLYNKDAACFIRNVLPKLSKNMLVYLDPPYYVKGKGLYENHYEHEDHELIARLVGKIKQKWIVSYDNVKEIRELYADYPKKIFSLHYSANNRYSGSEIMFFCKRLHIPGRIRPSRACAA